MNKTRLLFLIIFIEGYAVLACELLAIRLLIPFVGSGTETISIIISAVLLPLAIGYHAGGKAFAKNNGMDSVRRILLKNILSALTILGLGLSYIFLEVFFGILSGIGINDRMLQTAIYALIFLVYPVFLLGQTVPLISNYFNPKNLSDITGKMLFFSTCGSFLGSVFSTIILMTTVGVHNTVILTITLLFFLVLLLVRKLWAYEVWLGLAVLAAVFMMNNNAAMQSFHVVANNNYNLIRIDEIKDEDARVLNVNRSPSSKISADREHMFSYWKYIDDIFLKPIASAETPRDILVIGSGGFTLGLEDLHNQYTFVDIDRQLKTVAEKYFLKKPLDANKHFVPMSARAFVHGAHEKYDLIILDAFTNVYAVPMECTSQEFFADVKKLLKPGGAVVVNVIASPTFADRFTTRYTNTFASVFPQYTRQVLGDFNPWDTHPQLPSFNTALNNVLYIYYDRPYTADRSVYSDDKNTYSMDR